MTAGNILIGGVVGLGVDAVSGAINKYDPRGHHRHAPDQGLPGAGSRRDA